MTTYQCNPFQGNLQTYHSHQFYAYCPPFEISGTEKQFSFAWIIRVCNLNPTLKNENKNYSFILQIKLFTQGQTLMGKQENCRLLLLPPSLQNRLFHIIKASPCRGNSWIQLTYYLASSREILYFLCSYVCNPQHITRNQIVISGI